MVSNLSQKLSSLLKNSLLARLLLLKPLLLPLLLVPKPKSFLMEDSQLDSMVLSFLTMVLVPSDLTEEEDLEEVSDSEEDSDLEETHTDGLRLATTPNTPLLTHLMTLTSTL